MFDLIIRGGDVIDGSGSPPRRADVAVSGGRIVAIGEFEGSAAKVVDAVGKVVAPGFVDVHTHYDAQVMWDSMLSPRHRDGVTTVISGNCGFTIAPPGSRAKRTTSCACSPGSRACRWKRCATECRGRGDQPRSYFDSFEGNLGINAGFKIGHSAIRRVVMGADAAARPATSDEIDAMTALLRSGLEAGGIGFSSSWARTHADADGAMVPSRNASREELLALTATTGEYAGTSLEFIPMVGPKFEPWAIELMADMSVAAGRPLNWNVLAFSAATEARPGPSSRPALSHEAAAARWWRSRCRTTSRCDCRSPPASSWTRCRGGKSHDASAIGEDRPVQGQGGDRQAEGRRPESGQPHGRTGQLVHQSRLRRRRPRERARIAATTSATSPSRRGVIRGTSCSTSPCATNCSPASERPRNAENERRTGTPGRRVARSAAIIGASDAGAHLDMLTSFNYSTVLLGSAVREHHALPLEEVIHLITDVPAQLYGLIDRGRAPGRVERRHRRLRPGHRRHRGSHHAL